MVIARPAVPAREKKVQYGSSDRNRKAQGHLRASRASCPTLSRERPSNQTNDYLRRRRALHVLEKAAQNPVRSSSFHNYSMTTTKHSRRRYVASAALGALALHLMTASVVAAQTDPLSAWNDGAAKRAIVEFVHATTTPGAAFVPPDARIATFDQDGTLWVEHPMYSQVIYCLDRVPV